MAPQLISLVTKLDGPAHSIREVDTLTHGVLPGSEMSEVLFEQLGYLIQYADQERHCLERVKTILLETFN